MTKKDYIKFATLLKNIKADIFGLSFFFFSCILFISPIKTHNKQINKGVK